MPETPEQLDHILQRLESLAKKQESIQQEIGSLRAEISNLYSSPGVTEEVPASVPDAKIIIIPPVVEVIPAGKSASGFQTPVTKSWEAPADEQPRSVPGAPAAGNRVPLKSNLEKFIGENLINKIGIAITVIGVGIGVKYAIDHELISPWTRIILGYLFGLVLFGLAFRLKKEYANFSAVLLSGSMAIMYFITFAAFDFYSLIPAMLTFALMVMFTVFTVAAALSYDKQVIAHIGLVGAYAVPFLLDDGSGRVAAFFTYMAVINTGILVLSFRKYWKPLYYSSFILTWLIFYSWYETKYLSTEHFGLALLFTTVFFTIFYLIFLAYKLLKDEKSEAGDVLLLLINSAIFYALGYSILEGDKQGSAFLGLFTLINAAIHFAAALLIRWKNHSDRNLLYYTAGLALVFFSIAIPVQWDGRWVTLLWSGEVAALFWIGRTKNAMVYELLSYPLMLFVFISLVDDWTTVYNGYLTQDPATRIFPVFNINLLTSLFFASSFGFINFVNNQKKFISPLLQEKALLNVMNFVMPAILVIALYFAFMMEISTFWEQLYQDSRVIVNQGGTTPETYWNEDLLKYGRISGICYSLLFFFLLSMMNIRWLKSSLPGNINLFLNTVCLGIFLTLGLYTIGELRESYLGQALSGMYYRGGFNIGIRYISFVFAGLIVFSISRYIRSGLIRIDFRREFDLLLHLTLLTVAGNELINWMDLCQPGQSYKLGLSILFGLYALLLVVLGISRKKVHLRIAAIVLFGATLVKLIFYDISDLNTISKTIVFVSLGVLLLISSFLYTKYRKLIFDDDDEKRDGEPHQG